MLCETWHRGPAGVIRAGAFVALTLALSGVASAQMCGGGGGGGGGAAAGGTGGVATGGSGGTIDVGSAIQMAGMVQQAQQARAAMIMQAQQAELARQQQVRAAEQAKWERFKEMRQAARRRPQIRPARTDRPEGQISEGEAGAKRWGYTVYGRA